MEGRNNAEDLVILTVSNGQPSILFSNLIFTVQFVLWFCILSRRIWHFMGIKRPSYRVRDC